MKFIKNKLKMLFGVLLIVIGITPFLSNDINTLLAAENGSASGDKELGDYDQFIDKYFTSTVTQNDMLTLWNRLEYCGYDYSELPNLEFVLFVNSVEVGNLADAVTYLLNPDGTVLYYDTQPLQVDLRLFSNVELDCLFNGPYRRKSTEKIGPLAAGQIIYTGRVYGSVIAFGSNQNFKYTYKLFDGSLYDDKIIELYNNDNYTYELEETLYYAGWNDDLDYVGIKSCKKAHIKGEDYFVLLFDEETMYSYLIVESAIDGEDLGYFSGDLFPIDLRFFKYCYENPNLKISVPDGYRVFYVKYVDVESPGPQLYYYCEEVVDSNSNEFLTEYYKNASTEILNMYLSDVNYVNIDIFTNLEGPVYPYFINETPLPFIDINNQRYFLDLRMFEKVVIYKTNYGEIEYFKVYGFNPQIVEETIVEICSVSDFYKLEYLSPEVAKIYENQDNYAIYKYKKEKYNYPYRKLLDENGDLDGYATYDFVYSKHVCVISSDFYNMCQEYDRDIDELIYDSYFDLRDFGQVREYYFEDKSLFYISNYQPLADNSKSYSLFDYGDSDTKINIPKGQQYYMLYDFEIYEEKSLFNTVLNFSFSDLFGDNYFQSVDDAHYLYLFNIADSPLIPIMQSLDSVTVEYKGCEEDYSTFGQLMDNGCACKKRSSKKETIVLDKDENTLSNFYYQEYVSYADLPVVGETQDLLSIYKDKLEDFKINYQDSYNNYLQANSIKDSDMTAFSLMGLVNPSLATGMGAGVDDYLLSDIFWNYDYYFIIPQSQFVAYQMILTASITNIDGKEIEYKVIHNDGLGDGSQIEQTWWELNVYSKCPNWFIPILDWIEANFVVLIFTLIVIGFVPGVKQFVGWLLINIFKGLFKAIWFVISWPFISIYKLIVKSNNAKMNDQLYMKIPIDEKELKKMDDIFVYKE